MKKKHKSFLITAAIVLIAVLVPAVIFYSRAPVLIVTEQFFERLYGEERIKRENRRASLALLRPVKSVSVANDVGDDIASLAISDVSGNPFCVIFPFRFVRTADLYLRQNPHVPVILLEGRFAENQNPSAFAIGNNPSDIHIFKTDINADFYRAGLAAASIVEMSERAKAAEAEAAGESASNSPQGRSSPPRIAVFLEKDFPQAREAFLKAVNDYEPPPEEKSKNGKQSSEEDSGLPAVARVVPRTQFISVFSQFSSTPDLSCVVIVDFGTEYLENKAEIPVILFTWLDLFLIPDDVVLVIDDSPWAQAVKAVKMAGAAGGEEPSGSQSGLISSKFHFMKINKFDRETLRKIR